MILIASLSLAGVLALAAIVTAAIRAYGARRYREGCDDTYRLARASGQTAGEGIGYRLAREEQAFLAGEPPPAAQMWVDDVLRRAAEGASNG